MAGCCQDDINNVKAAAFDSMHAASMRPVGNQSACVSVLLLFPCHHSHACTRMSRLCPERTYVVAFSLFVFVQLTSFLCLQLGTLARFQL